MLKPDAKLSIQLILLECLQVKCYYDGLRYPERVMHYVKLLQEHQGQYAGLLYVVPSDTHPDMFALLDGHHRFCAYILAGRKDALCVVQEIA